jgi:4-amino-4-deoxy-L-arabinose transferase-like glycosyltransferase
VSEAAAVVRARALAIPAWAWLTAIVAGSAAVHIWLGRQVVAPWIMVDELIYSELAKSFAASAQFQIRGVTTHSFGFLYPMLIAPAWRIEHSIPSAYALAKGINSVLMSLVAIPVYFLARRLLSTPLALAAALLAVLTPSLLYTGVLMTENAFYPLFALVMLALVATLERPAGWRQVGLLALTGLAYLTRAQAVALVPALAVAPALLGLIDRDRRMRLPAFVPLYAILAGGAALALLATIARGRSPLDLLGAYRAATNTGYSATEIAKYALWHVAELDLYVGIVPFAALLALWLSPRALPPAGRAFVAASLPTSVFLILEVAAFATQPSVQRIEERNLFYLAPLALIALLVVASRTVRLRRAVLGGAAIVAAVLPVTIPFERFVTTSAVSDTFALLPWWWVQDHFVPLDDLRYAAFGCAVAAAVLFFFLPRRVWMVLPLLVGVYFVLTTAVVQRGRHGIRKAAVGSLWAGIRVTHPDWIDRALGTNANVTFLWIGRAPVNAVWDSEFFNRSVDSIDSVGGSVPGGLPQTLLHATHGGPLADASGKLVRASYVLSDADVVGKPVGRDPRIGLTLVRVNGPLIVQTHVDGVYGDNWSGPHVTYTRYRCTGGRVSVLLGSDPNLYTEDQVVTATVDGERVVRARIAPTAQARLVVPLRPDAERVCRVQFTPALTRVPGGTDTRHLGARFLRFDYLP